MKKQTPACNLVNPIWASEGQRAGSLQLVREARNPSCRVWEFHSPCHRQQGSAPAQRGLRCRPLLQPCPPSPPHCSSLQPLPAPQKGFCCDSTDCISVLQRFLPPLTKKITVFTLHVIFPFSQAV